MMDGARDLARGRGDTDSSEGLRVIWFSRDRSALLVHARSLKVRRPMWSVEPCVDATIAQKELTATRYDFLLLDCAEHSLSDSRRLFELTRNKEPAGRAVGLHAARDERDWARLGLMQMDDFVNKASSVFVPELCTRLERLAQRGRASEVRRFSGIEIDFITQMVRADGGAVQLAGHGWRIVQCLALAEGDCVSPEELCRFAGIQSSLSHANLQTEIWRLRNRLDKMRYLVESVRGRGYRLRRSS
jgi:DNA-binding response OmpR family regulator